MIPTTPVFSARQDRGWQGNYTFLLWVAGSALQGAVLRHKSGNDMTRDTVGSVITGFGPVGIAIRLAMLPLDISAWLANLDHQRHTKYLLQTMQTDSDDYLGWHEGNFRLSENQIAFSHFYETLRFLPTILRPQHLHIHLHDGSVCEFSLNSHREAEQLQRAMAGCGIAIHSRNES
ncbi:hypothetical protein IAD21_01828 [Abditibacteriota bacterium]|nr:hypothetical protein IAD21_01828 [Abditibacteriota bacterium]